MTAITTVPQRINTLLPRTLASLRAAGFDCPRICVDGMESPEPYRKFGLPVTTHYPKIRTYGNWALALVELYIRNPGAQMFAIFQDDFVTYRSLKSYLEKVPVPPRGYGNLYTFPQNQKRCPQGHVGWYLSDQRGMGAVALVFSQDAVMALLKSPHMVDRVHDPHRGWRSLDGGVLEAMRQVGWREYVHNPSLVQHTGMISSMSHKRFPEAVSFRGENFDVMEVLGLPPSPPISPSQAISTEPPPPPLRPDREQMIEFWESGTWDSSPPEEAIRMHGISPAAGQWVLDVGPGDSSMLEYLFERGCNVFAADISRGVLLGVEKFAKKSYRVRELPSAAFDLAIHHRVAQYTGDGDLTPDLDSIFRSLKHDGVLSIQFASGPTTRCGIEDQKIGQVHRTAEQMQQIIRDAGGEVIRMVCSAPASKDVTWHIFHCRSKT